MPGPMLVIIVSLLGTEIAVAGLEKYATLVVADPPNLKQAARTVRVTYLGVNGYEFEANGHALLVDPYFTRAGLTSVILQRQLEPNETRITFGLQRVRRPLDAVLVTHAHFDHLLDIPAIMRRSDARLVSGKTAVNLASSCGVDRHRCFVVQPGEATTIGPWRIHVLSTAHDRIFGWLPFPGTKARSGICPRQASDWRLGEPLAFLIEANGKRIYIDSGGTLQVLPPPQTAPVDLAILGMALPDSRKRLLQAIARLRPNYVLPSHQDDFFSPIERGFVFGKLTDFPGVMHLFQRRQINSHLILLDYFRPWTLP